MAAKKSSPKNPPAKKRPTRSAATKKRRRPPGADKFASLYETIINLVTEAVEARIRHRALINALRDGKPFEWDRYVAEFQDVGFLDRIPLTQSVLLKRDAFHREYATWLFEDLKKYGTSSARQHQGEIIEDEEGSVENEGRER